jgi:preprotein translocase subunit SecF
MNYQIVQKRNIWVAISALIFIAACVSLFTWGLKLGIDFTGGSLLEVKFLTARPTVTEVYQQLKGLDLNSLSVLPAGDVEMILRFQDSTEQAHQDVLKKLDEMSKVKTPPAKTKADAKAKNNTTASTTALTNIEQVRFDSVGPSIGNELRTKAFYAIFWVLIGIVIYISFAFRKVSKPVASWKYGLSALVAMFHDTIITLGAFAFLGHFYGIEINTPFVAAVLTVLGYSVHDTIVVFDRIRENLPRSNENFEGTVNTSLNQTLGRSINTSLTVLLTLAAILIFGGSSIFSFALALTIGIFFGTYSSIFLASPLLVYWDTTKK